MIVEVWQSSTAVPWHGSATVRFYVGATRLYDLSFGEVRVNGSETGRKHALCNRLDAVGSFLF